MMPTIRTTTITDISVNTPKILYDSLDFIVCFQPKLLSSLYQFLEVVSKRRIAFESKAQGDEKAQHTLEYVSILKRFATQLSDARWGFETTSIIF
jgi:hypothetical protein